MEHVPIRATGVKIGHVTYFVMYSNVPVLLLLRPPLAGPRRGRPNNIWRFLTVKFGTKKATFIDAGLFGF